MAKTTNTKPLPQLEAFQASVKTIMEDYVADPGMVKEIEASFLSFSANWNAKEKQVNDLMEEVKERDETITELRDEIKSLDKACDDKDTEIEILEKKVEELEESATDTDGCIVVQINNLHDEQRVHDFLTTQIYPYYNEQVANIK